MRAVKAFLLGMVAAALVVWAGLTAVAIALQTAKTEVEIWIGPLLLLDVDRGPDGSETTFGIALVCVMVVGGVVNAAAAEFLARRSRRPPPIA